MLLGLGCGCVSRSPTLKIQNIVYVDTAKKDPKLGYRGAGILSKNNFKIILILILGGEDGIIQNFKINLNISNN